MKKQQFCVLYLNSKCLWDTLKGEDNKQVLFNSINEAKSTVDELRKEGTHEICKVHKCVIYEYKDCTITGEGIRY